MHHPTETFRTITDANAAVVDTEPDPAAETPCPEWTYGQLLGHLVGGDRLFVGILSGRRRPPERPRMAPDADQPPPSPEDYRVWSRRLGDLLADPQVGAGTYTAPVGDLTGAQVTILRSVEHLLHGWDLARAAGVATTGLESSAAALAGPARGLLAALDGTLLADRRPFAEPVVVDQKASAVERLAAMFGRDPAWQPDAARGYERVKERFVHHEDVELPDGSRRGYGADGMRVRGQVFACTYRGRMMIKLPESEVDGLIESGIGWPLAKPNQRPMREWVLVPIDGAATARAERAYAFVRPPTG